MRGISKFSLAMLLASLELGSVAAQDRTPVKPSDPAAADARAAAFIAVFHTPAPNGYDEERQRARAGLVAMGKAALPKLLDIVADPEDSFAWDVCYILIDIGKPAVEPVRARWPNLDVKSRWILMDFRGKHDYVPAADYALEFLKSNDEKLRLQAWKFLLDHKEKRIEEEFYRNLRGQAERQPCTYVVCREPVFDAEKELDLLIALLAPDSWMSLDRGYPQRPRVVIYEPNDERTLVIDVLAHRKAKRAAPALLKVLTEEGSGRAYFGGTIVPLLGDFGYKEAIPELKRILDTDAKLFVRKPGLYSPDRIKMMAARALWQLGDLKGQQYLAPFIAIKDNSGSDRRFAAESYALCGDKSDIQLLAKLLDDPEYGVRQAACRGLERITGVNIHAPIIPNRKAMAADAPLWKAWYEKEYAKKP